jgi:hypothetical protein
MHIPRRTGSVFWSALTEAVVIALAVFAAGYFCCFVFVPAPFSHSPDFERVRLEHIVGILVSLLAGTCIGGVAFVRRYRRGR